MRNIIRIIGVLFGLALAGLYLHGSFDRPLSSIGLNYHECARNGLGATFCGKELETYRARMQKVQINLEQIKTNLHAKQEQLSTNEAQRAYENSPEGQKSAEQREEAQRCKCDPTARKP